MIISLYFFKYIISFFQVTADEKKKSESGNVS